MAEQPVGVVGEIDEEINDDMLLEVEEWSQAWEFEDDDDASSEDDEPAAPDEARTKKLAALQATYDAAVKLQNKDMAVHKDQSGHRTSTRVKVTWKRWVKKASEGSALPGAADLQ